MTQFPASTTAPTSGRRLHARAAIGAFAAALAAATPATAFHQQTTLEGTVGKDVAGVWLSVQQIMPEFRITWQKKAEGRPIPFTVAAVPADLEPVTGKDFQGVAVDKCTDAAMCAELGILEGDVVVAVNSTPTPDPAAFEARLGTLPAAVMLSVRRPALKMTTARLLKIRHQPAGPVETEGVTTMGDETLDLKVLDVALPFAGQLEKSRQTHDLFQPSAADLEALGANWFDLPGSSPATFIQGTHRFVAAANYDDALSADKSLPDTTHAIVMDLSGNPIRGGGGKVVDIYGVRNMDGKSMEGRYVSATIATAPFPINVEFKGRFRMTRIADWSDQDDKVRAARMQEKKPEGDLRKYETVPDVPPPSAN